MVATSVRSARRQPDALGDHRVDHRRRQAFEQRDALAQCRLEFDLAAHGALGDRRDAIFQAGIVGQFVDAFLADHGGIHVGDSSFLRRPVLRLHDDIDRLVADDVAQIAGEVLAGERVLRRRGLRVLGFVDQKRDIDRDAGISQSTGRPWGR